VTHRVEQIVQAIATVLTTALGPTGAHVYTHRGNTLDGEQDELPGVSVDFGELEVIEETEDELYWSLAVPITAVVKLPTESEVKTSLMALARQIHQAIMVSPGVGLPWRVTLGLTFVITVHPLGWDAPEYNAEGEEIVGKLTINWSVDFRTDVDDTGDG
jgi:hypothetical protein